MGEGGLHDLGDARRARRTGKVVRWIDHLVPFQRSTSACVPAPVVWVVSALAGCVRGVEVSGEQDQTTPAAIAARRSDRLLKPAQSTYVMQDSIENHTSV